MSDTYRITSNNRPRPMLPLSALTADEQREFDYLDGDEWEANRERFVRAYGSVWDVFDAQRVEILPDASPLNNWDGFTSVNMQTAATFRFADPDAESVIVGWYAPA